MAKLKVPKRGEPISAAFEKNAGRRSPRQSSRRPTSVICGHIQYATSRDEPHGNPLHECRGLGGKLAPRPMPEHEDGQLRSSPGPDPLRIGFAPPAHPLSPSGGRAP